jgi:hypothetical protein
LTVQVVGRPLFISRKLIDPTACAPKREGRVRARGLFPALCYWVRSPPAASPRDCAGAIGALTAMGQEWPEYGGSLAGSGTRPRNRLQLAYDNLWDYDTASQPPLFVWCGNLPAVAMMNKTGWSTCSTGCSMERRWSRCAGGVSFDPSPRLRGGIVRLAT